MPEERPRRTTHGQESKKTSASGWQLIAVQSISCLVIILIATVFRLIGGTAFAQLRQSFNQSIMSNSVIATLTALLDSPPADTVSSTPETSDSSTTTTGTDTTATNETTGTDSTTASTTTITAEGVSSTGTTAAVVATGGQDMPVINRKILYAPEGATFTPLKVSSLACKPLESGTITSYFGYRENPTKGGESFHQGLDIAASSGAPIASMFFGVVSEVSQNSSYGNYVKLYHGNGLETIYAHCSEILVQKNAVIRAGEIVAKVGSTGDSTGPHLHIEMKLNGIAYDPSTIVPIQNYA